MLQCIWNKKKNIILLAQNNFVERKYDWKWIVHGLIQVDMCVVDLELKLVFQFLDLNLLLNFSLVAEIHMILVESILDSLKIKSINFLIFTLLEKKDQKYILWIGLNVCELIECSPLRCCTLCSLCRKFFSHFVDDASFIESVTNNDIEFKDQNYA